MNKPSIGIFGSAFDPPSLGHQNVLQQVSGHFDLILLVPSASHAFNKRSLPFDIRVEMLDLFIKSADVDCPLETCELEVQLLTRNPRKPVYTFDLLEALEREYQGKAVLTFIRGPDNANPETWNRFYRAQDIEERWSIITAEERLNVRSSKVRAILNDPMTADGMITTLDDFLLPSVSAYIRKYKLYTHSP